MASEPNSIWVDGCPARALPLPDRGLDFGDGLFETLLLLAGKPLYLELHMQRLEQGLRALGFPNCLDEIRNQIHSVLNSGDFPGEMAMRVTVTRGGGPRGYTPPPATVPRVIIVTSVRAGQSYLELPSPARLAVAKIRWGCQPMLAGIKHLNRLEQVLAAREREAAAVDEVVMLNQAGGVVSVSTGNLFIADGNELLTPHLSECGVYGTRRRLVIEQLAPAHGLQVREVELTVAQVESAGEAFYCNALVGLRPVGSFGAARWESHKVCSALHTLLCEGAQ